jgi:glyoxylase-like metal-dependent hydrolase (beta-lactamase superfamily II)
MRVQAFSLPTPFYIGPVNVYLIEDEPLTIIDTGPRSDETMKVLRENLARLGRRLSDIKRIIITHAHADHYGLAGDVIEESGADAFVHEWDAQMVSGAVDYSVYKSLFDLAGVPADVIERMEAGSKKFSGYARAIESVKVLKDEDEIVFDSGSLKVIHTPGHTPGSICLVRTSNREIFASDTVLKSVTPNPVLSVDPIDERKRFQSLGEYLVSLARIRALSPTLLRGGHGADVIDYEEYFTRLYRFTQSRQTKLLSILPKSGATAWEASHLLFPNANGYHRFLALSETSAHLDYATSDGKLTLENREAQEVYRRV